MTKSSEAKSSSIINQFKAGIICNLTTLNAGLGVGWISPAIPQFLSPNGPLGPVTLDQTAWLAGVFPLGAFCAAPLVAYFSQVFGRKFSLIFWGLPYAINAIIGLLTSDINYLIAGRFIMGFGMSGCIGNITAYIGEIAEPKIRGRLSSLFGIFYTSGITLAYITGGFVSYIATTWVMLVIAAIGTIACIFLPETPVYLVRRGNVEKAIESLAWLRGLDVDDKDIKAEVVQLQNVNDDKPTSTLQAIKILVFDKATRKAFLLCSALFTLQAYMGMFAVHGYSVTIFMEGGAAQLTPESAATLYGCIQMLGTFSASQIIDKWGRKILMTLSALGVAICMMILATYFYMKYSNVDVGSFKWIPVVALCFCIYIYSCGAAVVPFIYVSDVLPYEVKTLATMLINQNISLNAFLLLRFFAPLSVSIGMHNLFYIFGSISVLATLFSLFFMLETKGKSTKDILDHWS